MSVVKAGPPDKECLYCALDVEDVTLKGSLSPAHIRSRSNNLNNNNKNFHEHNFYRPVQILLLTKEEEKKNFIYFIPTSYSHQNCFTGRISP